MSPRLTDRATTAAEDAAAPVQPRAEFRVFGHGIIDAVKARMWNGRTVLLQARRMPSETYLLSRRTRDANVKVRDGVVDIKLKTGVTPEGYEVFQPSGKFRFPLEAGQLKAIFEHLRVPMPEALRQSAPCALEPFLAAARAHDDLVAVAVDKMRWGFTIDGVICEYAQVYFNGALLESACVESERRDAMRAVIDELGLSAWPNVNYLAAAARVVGLE